MMGSALSDACKVPVYIQAEKMRTRKYGKYGQENSEYRHFLHTEIWTILL